MSRWTPQDLADYQARRGLSVADAPAKKNKYRNKKTEVDGVVFHSRREASRYQDLTLMERLGQITGLTLQPKFPLIVEGTKVGTYIGDFLYFENGERIVEDTKSPHLRKEMYYRLKKRLFKALYGIEIRET